MSRLKKTPEERAAAEEQERQEELGRQWQAFWSSPVGRARQAFEAGLQIFQSSFDVMAQQGWAVAMDRATTTHWETDPTQILNAICKEGWELVSGDFQFIQTGQVSRDKFMSSGQQTAVAGTVVGYYLFKRCDANRVQDENPPQVESTART